MTKTTFTLAEAAVLLSCHAETLRRAIKNGALHAARLGRGYRISRTDLQAFWAECGGSDLFGAEELPLPPPETASSAPLRRKREENTYTQLKLLE